MIKAIKKLEPKPSLIAVIHDQPCATMAVEWLVEEHLEAARSPRLRGIPA